MVELALKERIKLHNEIIGRIDKFKESDRAGLCIILSILSEKGELSDKTFIDLKNEIRKHSKPSNIYYKYTESRGSLDNFKKIRKELLYKILWEYLPLDGYLEVGTECIGDWLSTHYYGRCLLLKGQVYEGNKYNPKIFEHTRGAGGYKGGSTWASLPFKITSKILDNKSDFFEAYPEYKEENKKGYNINFKVNDRVFDYKYGWGVVHSISNQREVFVRFDNHLLGIKKYIAGTKDLDFLSFTKYDLINGGLSQKRLSPYVEVDTPVFVRDETHARWSLRYFKKWAKDGKIITFPYQKTSKESPNGGTTWDYYSLEIPKNR